ncbi:CDK5 and ABL1 enzyme substrate 2 [Thelohanellus kitauei]|uniref:CDK5 and ABL1 enzyme substrate 2 n=1 Tax=Thelohanellus kitauei TaxID=669202 RepID=A0A0C2MB99_THEKT|nr:CDK5 and ABL1 enzyme substrate 2 [Thelohanellus kitauei]
MFSVFTNTKNLDIEENPINLIPAQNKNVRYFTKCLYEPSRNPNRLSNHDQEYKFNETADFNDLPPLEHPNYNFQCKSTKLFDGEIVLSSVIHDLPESDEKQVMNANFQNMFPHVRITLTKMRSLKNEIRTVGAKLNIADICCAYSAVYFEWMIHKQQVTKSTRRPIAAACLFYCIKLLEDHTSEAMHEIMETIMTDFKITHASLIEWELMVMYCLDFGKIVSHKLIDFSLEARKI